jgi:AraC family transcriptional activator of pobA
MLTADEKVLLEDYKKAFKAYYQNKEVVDLDKKLPRKIEHFLVRLEEVLPALAMTVPPSKQSNFSILYVTEGGGEHTVGSIVFEIKERTLIVIPACTLHSANYTQSKGYDLTFNLRFFLQDHFPGHHLLKMDLFSPHYTPYTYVDLNYGREITSIFEMLFDEKFHTRKKKEEMIALKILELIIYCERLLQVGKSNQKKLFSPLVVKFMDLLKEDYRTHHAVSFYAEKLHIHPNSLNANTKKYLGKPAKTIIDTMLINEAEYLLVQTSFSVKEIAYELGFRSASHFFRFFKKHKEISPALYRNQMFENVAN